MRYTKATVSYTRTIQVEPFHPITPSVTVEIEIGEDEDVASCVAEARLFCRKQVKDEFAGTIPRLSAKMDEDFVRRWVAQASDEQICVLSQSLSERSIKNEF